MDEVREYLADRKREVNMHLRLVDALERRSTETQEVDDDLNVDVRQVLILKASILVHLYNVIEATMAKSLEVIEVAIHGYHPKDYSEELFDKWVVTNIRISDEINVDKLNKRAKKMGRELLAGSDWSKLSIQKTDGNWDDKRIVSLAEKLGINIVYPRAFKAKLRRPYFNELSMMEYIRKRRNDLAHGFITFEDGADNKTYMELNDLANMAVQFMELVVDACHEFVSNEKFLK
jgi:hypothetical protein